MLELSVRTAMAARSFFLSLKRSCNSSSLFHASPQTLTRSLASGAMKADLLEQSTSSADSEDDLKSRIFRLRFSKRSATNAIQRWIGEGRTVTLPELRKIAKDLNRAQRYKHALEISEWMVTHPEFELSDHDYAIRIDLVTKVFGTSSAQEFFEGLPPAMKTGETFTALLHSYASAKQTEMAEELFERIKELNLTVKVLAYNEMMTLYMSTGQIDKVPLVVEDLKKRNISHDLFTYNLWASACAATLDIAGVRRILDEMSSDPNANEGWQTYVSLTRIYIMVGHLVNSNTSAPVEAEQKMTQREWITYDFLVILYTSLGNKERVSEIWKSLRMSSLKMTSRNYTCILSSYLVLGQLQQAGELVDEWKRSVQDFDLGACKRLFDMFGEVGLMDEAWQLRKILIQSECELTDWPNPV